MKIEEGQASPLQKAEDVYGKEVSLQGSKVVLSFQRNAGCPICNVQVHELLKYAETFHQQGILIVLVYQSSVDNLREYISQEPMPFHFISDPANKLYKPFGIEKSFRKFLKGLFSGALSKVVKGNSLFKKKIKVDGDVSLIGSDFIIRDGIITKARYGKFVGDHLTPQEIFAHLN